MKWVRAALAVAFLIAAGVLAYDRAQRDRWQANFDAGRAALRQSLLGEGQRRMEVAVAASRSFGARDPRRARALTGLGFALVARGKDEEADETFREALALLEAPPARDDQDTADCLSGLATAAGHRARDAEARSFLERALAILRQRLGPDHPEVARALNDLAWVECNEGRYAAAEALSRKALAIREKAADPAGAEVGGNLSDLAWFLIRQDRFTEAAPLLRRASPILSRHETERLAYASCLNRQAVLDASCGRHGDAEALNRQALKAREETLGPNHPDVGASLSNLASALRDLGRYDEARPLFGRATRIFEEEVGPDSPGLAWVLVNTARAEAALGKRAEAEALFRRALAIREKTFGPSHPEVGFALSQLAELVLDRDRPHEAEELARRVLEILERKDHRIETARCLDVLGRVAAARGESKQAEAEFRSALALRREVFPDGDAKTADVLDHCAGVLRETGRTAEAATMEGEAEAMRARASDRAR